MVNEIAVIGLGRIGRHLVRELLRLEQLIHVEIHDLNADLDNICYLLNYDSVYGYREERFINKTSHIYCSETKKRVFFRAIDSIESSIVIDSTGSPDCLSVLSGTPQFNKIYVTHTPSNNVDEYIIANVSQNSDKRVVSTSICDTTAIAPILLFLERNYGIKHGHVTTLHPWLNYQNLSDGSVISTAVPNNYWSDYGLGRKSTENIIPKSTSAISALGMVFPLMSKKLDSWSFRVPTPVVSTALLNINMNSTLPGKEKIIELVGKIQGVTVAKPHLTSLDYIGIPYNCAVDGESVSISDHSIYLSLWYDNELGYVRNIIDYITGDSI
jgi:glyceraldehyde 3-phosphate dehydrogenase